MQIPWNGVVANSQYGLDETRNTGCRELALTNFGSVNFSDASVDGRAIDDPAWNVDPLTMVTGNGTAKATPSSLDPTGSAFSVTWHHS